MNPLDIVSLNTIASKLYENVCRPICRKYDLNQTCFDVILFLANNPSHNTARDLCELRGIRTGNASVAIETLAKRGFLTRSQDSSDRRIQRLILTDLADPVTEEGRLAQEEFGTLLNAGISHADLEQAWYVLQKIQQNILSNL